MSRCPFEMTTKRIIQRQGKPVFILDENGVALPEKRGVLSHPEQDATIKGKKGGITATARRPELLMLTADCVGISKAWRIRVNGVDYFAATWPDDGYGGTRIHLSYDQTDTEQTPASSPGEGVSNADTWR